MPQPEREREGALVIDEHDSANQGRAGGRTLELGTRLELQCVDVLAEAFGGAQLRAQ